MHNIDRNLAEFDTEMDPYDTEMEYEFEYDDSEYAFTEADEMELAAELLEVVDEDELDQFLGRVIRRVGRGVRRAVRSPVARALGGALRGVAKKALPGVGAAIGTAIAPGLGTKVGGALGSAASNLFEMELEGLSPEDQEFEVARRFVQLAGDAARKAAAAVPTASPQAAARSALVAAARKHAPGLLRPSMASSQEVTPTGSGRSGRWVRRGRKIVLMDV